MIQLEAVMDRFFASGINELRVKLELAKGNLTALIGPSGSGKTTLLRLLAGLETPRQGYISVDGTPWLDTQANINLSPQRRSVGFVFQDAALFPNMSVRQNIAYVAPSGQEPLVAELLKRTGLEPFADKKPAALSGGQKQRVALARAMVRRPKILLLDEPFAALDATASQWLREMLLQFHQEWETTTLLVSHHAPDISHLADRIIQLVHGQIVSDHNNLEQRQSPSITELIQHIDYDPVHQQWTIQTDSTQLVSKNPNWRHLKVGDSLRINGQTDR
ncbi:sulfate/molybdate ABC transporter ATP-binding protein [Tellurirhabdus bombi]|uniref:sulfate/molybdate ABC transporter ATP-binding protein n=1 Tax=Tellurirhabdus bombi TaxID=2907205 RepID=UPI001F417370|nr:ABC transporter ATP-binding protein [Tellurirhabdus bombi]